MRLLKEERGVYLLEVVASIILITIILISFFGFFLQSKKTHVASESIVDATYIAQQYMEEIYGIVSVNNNGWLSTAKFTLQGKEFTCPKPCSGGTDYRKFLSSDNPKHWIEFQKSIDYPESLVNVVVNVPKKNSSTPVTMESIFRWGIKP